jgi:hypothetical protein
MDLAELVRRFLWDGDLVLAEGFKTSSHPRIEVYRGGSKEVHGGDSKEEPLLFEGAEGVGDAPQGARDGLDGALGPPEVLALVTDAEGLDVPYPVFRTDDPGDLFSLADLVEAFMARDGAR